MQFLVLLSLLLLLRGTEQLSHNRNRCLLYKDKCVLSCPHNMHAYHTRCDRDTWSQRTCAFPYSYRLGFTCGWSRCDCNADLVLDEETDSCIREEYCSGKVKRQKDRKKSRSRRLRLRKKEDDGLLTIING